MVKMVAKQQKRVYSLKPNRSSSLFARKFVSYLLPALKRMSKERDEYWDSNSDGHGIHELQKIVGYQVNMAMVLSASTHGKFAWMRALKRKLETDFLNGKRLLLQPPPPTCANSKLPLSFTRNPSCDASYKMKKYYYNCSSAPIRVRRHFPATECLAIEGNDCTKKVNEEAEIISRKVTCLRRLLPGGNEMGDNELLEEVGSYVNCLQLQVNILQCLVRSNSIVDKLEK